MNNMKIPHFLFDNVERGSVGCVTYLGHDGQVVTR